jgi:hypothetical protein
MSVLHQGPIAVFDDSFQPTGTIHWHKEGRFKIPTPHAEMKKLRHELILTVEGPDDFKGAVENCFKQAAISASIAAVAASFIGAGIGATSAAWETFQVQFLACAGGQVHVRIDDSSHWITWDT